VTGRRTEEGAADVEKRSLGHDRMSVPTVGLGTWRRLEAAAADGRQRELIGAAIAAGIRLIDTSPMYGDAERLLGAALTGRRDQVIIADKIWTRSAQEGAAQLDRRPPGLADLEPLRPFGVTTWAQALIKWGLSDPRVQVSLVATAHPARLAENAAAGSPPWFGPDERRYVLRLAATR
jgi:aryl-alcohol dehydrogenase-like predicted oxidoreductase